MRFSSKQYRSLNEAINNVQDPQYYTTEEYTEILEDLVEALCEELDVDPYDLFEDVQTPARGRETRQQLKRLRNTANTKERLWSKTAPFSNSSVKAENELDAAADRVDNKVISNYKERRSKKVFGRGGKIVTRTKR